MLWVEQPTVTSTAARSTLKRLRKKSLLITPPCARTIVLDAVEQQVCFLSLCFGWVLGIGD
jgi:hypothetical protein